MSEKTMMLIHKELAHKWVNDEVGDWELADHILGAPEAPSVEVPGVTMKDLQNAWDLGVALDSDFRWPGFKRTLILNQIHDLLTQATKTRSSK